MDFTGQMRTTSKGDSSAAPKDVPQASTQTELYDFCLKKSSGLCVLALLDASSPSFAEHTQIASAAAGRWERQPLQFSWIDAARQVHHPSRAPRATLSKEAPWYQRLHLRGLLHIDTRPKGVLPLQSLHVHADVLFEVVGI